MTRALHEIRRLVEGAQRVLIIAHVTPDGDTVGSALGLAWALRKQGIAAQVTCAEPISRSLRFLPGSDEFCSRTLTDEDLVVAVDSSDTQRLGDVYDAERFARVPLIVIDHHITNLGFGTVNYIQDRSSTAELVLDLLEYLGIPLDETIATCLMTGLVTDTQSFRTTSTTAQSLQAAVTLVQAGADLRAIMQATFKQRSMRGLEVWGEALSRSRFVDGVVWTEITRDMLPQTVGRDDVVTGLVSFLASVDEALIAAVFREVGDHRVEVSLRSVPGVDVSGVALRCGGGGHPQAAGCTITGGFRTVVDQVLGALREVSREACQKDEPIECESASGVV